MSGKKATVARLCDLHNLITEALIEGCSVQEIEIDDGGEKRTVRQLPSAAVLAVGLAHLKNNSITADPETNDRLRTLEDKLQKRRTQARASVVDMEDAAITYQSRMQ